MPMACARTRWPTVGKDLKLLRALVIGVTDLACGSVFNHGGTYFLDVPVTCFSCQLPGEDLGK
jgi:hypothetical protein